MKCHNSAETSNPALITSTRRAVNESSLRGDISPNQLEIAPYTAGEPDSRQSDLGESWRPL